MKKIIINTLIVFTITATTFTLSSCGGADKKSDTADTKTVNDTTKKEDGITEVTAEQMKAVDIELGLIEQKNLTSVVKANGQLTVPPQNKAVVNALVGGVIRRITVVEGQNVSKGQEVAVIENPDFIRLQQDYLTSKDNLVYLSQEYERQKQLKDADAGIGKVFQQASANYTAEKSKLLTLEKQLQQVRINPSQVDRGNLKTQVAIVAPISGTIGHITLNVGTYTDAASPIMEIVNNSTIYCALQVYEKDIAKVSTGQTVNFTLTNQNDKQVSGRITGINKSFEQQNKSVVVHAVLNNAAALNLIAGMYVSALIETGKQLVSAVPKDAVVKANDKSYIFVFEGMEKELVKPDKEDKKADKSEMQEVFKFKKVEVITGVEELGYVEIRLLEELPLNTKIVTKGAFYVYSKMQNIETDDIQ